MIRQILLSNGSSQGNFIAHLLSSVAITTAVLWLLGERLKGYKGPTSFFIALGILAILGVISTFSFSGFSINSNVKGYFSTYGIWAVVTLLGLTMAALRCRKKYSPKRFMLLLLLWMIIFTFACMVLVVVMTGNFKMIILILIQIPMVGSVLSLIFYLIVLPYMILVFRSPFFRERFYGCFGISNKQQEQSDAQIASDNINI